MVNTDLSFITNEGDVNLLERFKALIRGTRFFDALVGYFYTSGFHLLCDALEPTERIRILIGIGTGKDTTDLIAEARRPAQRELGFSHRQAADAFAEAVAAELEPPAQDDLVEHGVRKFVEWLRSGKLQIRAYPDANIHAKLYIMTFAEGDRDAGHVAYATIGKADLLVSLNLRHLANEWAERKIGAVNLQEGYQLLRIRTPEEVLAYEE